MPKIVTVPLPTPIVRGDDKLESIQLRKPTPGELRGLSISQLIQGDVDQIIELLPRITMPPLMKPEIMAMEDGFTELANEVVGFLLPSSARPVTD